MFYLLLSVIPKNLLSFFVGRLALFPVPVSCRRAFYTTVARRLGIDLTELGAPLESYRSFSEFFSRSLRADARPIDSGVVSPADGQVRECDRLSRGDLLQGKGMRYSLAELLPDEQLQRQFASGTACTIYLSPRDYHRVHMPVDGEVHGLLYVPGSLWPVNQWSVERVPRLFAVNERLVFLAHTALGELAIVMVGATNVGAISTPLHSIVTNSSLAQALSPRSAPPVSIPLHRPVALGRGDLLGTFHLGSTVIMLLAGSELRQLAVSAGEHVRMGQALYFE